MVKREEPKFDEYGFTQWMWRVLRRQHLKLGKNVSIGSFSVLDASADLEIEDDVEIGWSCKILTQSTIGEKFGKIIIKRGAKIGADTIIMPNITIGEGAVVGANSFVNRDIPSNEVWAGTPIRKLMGKQK